MNISIALCSFNGATFLPDQLNSIKIQSLKPDEVVICDDGSSDGTQDLLRLFKEQCHFPVQLFCNETRLGSLKNFEKAIGICKGDIIVLADQDDVWSPEKLEVIENAFKKHPDVGYLFTDAELVDEEGNLLGRSLWGELGFSLGLLNRFLNGEQLHCLFRKPIITGATLAIRGLLKQSILPVPGNTIFVHDLWIALVASSIGMPGLPLPDKLVKYRLHSTQQVGVKQTSLTALFKDIVEFDKNNFKEFIDAYDCLIDRLLYLNKMYDIEVKDQILQIERKQKHLNIRYSIHSDKYLSKYILLIKEIISGGYRDYSDSWKSIIRDIFSGYIVK